jgi:hypothetical protein
VLFWFGGINRILNGSTSERASERRKVPTEQRVEKDEQPDVKDRRSTVAVVIGAGWGNHWTKRRRAKIDDFPKILEI